MIYDLLLRGGTLVTPKDTFLGDIAVANGRIAAILAPGQPAHATHTLDLAGKHILPGIIDAHVHFRDPGLTYKEDFATGSRSAVMGGITTVIDMPNVQPVTATTQALQEKLAVIGPKAYLDYGNFCVLTDENLEDMRQLADVGICGFKIYIGSSVGNIKAPGEGIMLDQMKKAASMGYRVGFHAEISALNDACTAKLQNSGTTNPEALADARPDLSEACAVATAIAYARYTGAAIHIYHLSSAVAMALIADAKRCGVDVTAETGPQYLLLDRRDYKRIGVDMKVFPPVRSADDRKTLWNGLLNGTIDMIATDHAPHTSKEKEGGLWAAAAGTIGVETSVPLMLTQVNNGLLTLNKYVQLASEAPARIWGLYPQKGSLLVGTDADFTVVDMNCHYIIQNKGLHGLSQQGPFDGYAVTAAPWATIVRGGVVMLEGKLLGQPGYGQMLSSTARRSENL